MMNHVCRPATIERHVERVKHEFGAQMIGHRPTDDAATVDVKYDREKEKTAPGWHVRNIRNPELIGRACGKVAVDEVRSWTRVAIADRRFEPFSPCSAVDFALSHDARNALVAHAKSLIAKVLTQPRAAVRRTRLPMQYFEAIAKHDVVLSTQRRRSLQPCVIATRRYVEHFAENRCFKCRLVRLHEFESLRLLRRKSESVHETGSAPNGCNTSQ